MNTAPLSKCSPLRNFVAKCDAEVVPYVTVLSLYVSTLEVGLLRHNIRCRSV